MRMRVWRWFVLWLVMALGVMVVVACSRQESLGCPDLRVLAGVDRVVVDDGASTVYISELVGECFSDARDVFVRIDVSATLEAGVAAGVELPFFIALSDLRTGELLRREISSFTLDSGEVFRKRVEFRWVKPADVPAESYVIELGFVTP